MSVLGKGVFGPVQPLHCSSRRHDSPVLPSSKPTFIKVPTVFSSHISDHFLSPWSQDQTPPWLRLFGTGVEREDGPSTAAAPARPPTRQQAPRSVGPRTGACPRTSSWRREPQIADPGHLPGVSISTRTPWV